MTRPLYTPGKGYDKSAICKRAAEIKASGMFDSWTKISARERWGVILKTAWREAQREKQKAEYEAYQADLARKIAEARARAEAYVPSTEPAREMTAQEMIDHIYATAGTLD